MFVITYIHTHLEQKIDPATTSRLSPGGSDNPKIEVTGPKCFAWNGLGPKAQHVWVAGGSRFGALNPEIGTRAASRRPRKRWLQRSSALVSSLSTYD